MTFHHTLNTTHAKLHKEKFNFCMLLENGMTDLTIFNNKLAPTAKSQEKIVCLIDPRTNIKARAGTTCIQYQILTSCPFRNFNLSLHLTISDLHDNG